MYKRVCDLQENKDLTKNNWLNFYKFIKRLILIKLAKYYKTHIVILLG